MPETLNKGKEVRYLLEGEFITPQDFQEALALVAETIAEIKANADGKVQSALTKLEADFKALELRAEGLVEGLRSDTRGDLALAKADLTKLITALTTEFRDKLKAIDIPKIDNLMSRDEFDQARLGLLRDFTKEIKYKKPEDIRDALESLKDDERLDKSAIKGLEETVSRKDLDYAIATLQQQTSFLINRGAGSSTAGISDINGLIAQGSNVTITGSGTLADPYVINASGSGAAWGSITGTLADQTDLQSALDAKQPLDSDLTTIAGLTATTDSFMQAKGSAWAARTIAQVKTDLGLAGNNTGDQTSIVGISGTKAQFDTAVSDGNFLFVGDISQYTDEMAQDAVGAMIDTDNLAYTDGTPLLSVKLQMSLVDDASGIKLSGDSATPGNSKYYGTDGSGTKGWHALPAGGAIAWGDITGTLADQTDLQSALDAKQDVLTGLTASVAELNILDGATLTVTELNYVDGVTSAIQTQLDAKAPLTAPTFATSITGSYLTASELLITNGSKNIVSAPVATYPSLTELTYLKGVTSAIQTQFTAKAPLASPTFTGTVSVPATNFTVGASIPFSDSAGTLTLQNVDALDATTEATIEAAIDTLANLTSIQGRTVTLADAGANAFFGWDDTAGAYENLTQAEARTILGLGTAAYVATDLSDLNEATIEAAIDTLANLTSIQGRTITLADAGADALLGWDDSANAYQNLSAADVKTALSLNNVDNTSDATKNAASVSLTNKTIASALLTGVTLLSEGASIGLDPALSADGTWSGITRTGTAGYSQAFGDLVYLDPTDSRWEAVDANAASGADGDARGILGMVVVAGTDGNACTILLQGTIRADAKFPSFTINAPIFASETAGSVTNTRPSTTDVVIRVVGFGVTADEMYFNPSQDFITNI
jgi:hypothetical protein